MTTIGRLRCFFFVSLVVFGQWSTEIHSKPIKVIDSHNTVLEKDELEEVRSLINFKSRKNRSVYGEDSMFEEESVQLDRNSKEVSNWKELQNSLNKFEQIIKSMQKKRSKRSEQHVPTGPTKIPTPLNAITSENSEQNLDAHGLPAAEPGPTVKPHPVDSQEQGGQVTVKSVPVENVLLKLTPTQKLKITTKHMEGTAPLNHVKSVTLKAPTEKVQSLTQDSKGSIIQGEDQKDPIPSEEIQQPTIKPTPENITPAKLPALAPMISPEQVNGNGMENGEHPTQQVQMPKTVQATEKTLVADEVTNPIKKATESVAKHAADTAQSVTKTVTPCEGNNCIQVRVPTGRNKDALWALGSLTFLLLLLTGAVLYTGLWKKRHGKLKRWHKHDRRDSLSVAALLKRKPSKSSSNGYHSDTVQNGKKDLTNIVDGESSDDDYL
ncbi:uncharacterized protein LOC144449046 [Glandiceps talaboti]